MVPKADPARARDAATRIVRRLRDAGHTAYFAGGCVRDELLGLAPTDYDVATDATPDRVGSLFPRTNEVGASFGVVLVKTGGVTVEVATFRSEGPYSDRRRPDTVTFSTAEADAARRDFTVNALFLDPLEPGDPASSPPDWDPSRGRLIDHVGGRPDLERKVLRAVGDPEQRLAEDHLRALRAVRIAARLGLRIDPATAAAIRAHARDLRGVSRERIGEEIRRTLTHATRAEGVRLLHTLGLDAPVLGVPGRPLQPRALPALPPDAPYALCLAAWALDLGIGPDPDAVAGWRAALALSNDDRDDLAAILGGLAALERDWPSLPPARQKRLAAARWFPAALLLQQTRDPAAAAAVGRRADQLAASPSGLSPPPLVSGDDLVARGLAPGPIFRKILDTVYDAQLEERIVTKEQALGLALELAGPSGVEEG